MTRTIPAVPLARGSELERAAVRRRFRELLERWKAESAAMSSPRMMADLESYRLIVALGPLAVPLILDELEREPDYWFSALEELTGETPKAAGQSLAAQTVAWLCWAERARQ
ncbi:MAG: hypothetical protein IT204_08790 [Fimbriimonadaceae bacterium]|nr:hypothetical protein [Fimbriimonadaceae bacterium]